jgi:hypothetical protein
MFIVFGDARGELRQEFNVSCCQIQHFTPGGVNRQRPRDYKHSTTTWLSDRSSAIAGFPN